MVASVVPIHIHLYVYSLWLVIDVQICMSNRTLDVMQTVDTVEFNAYKSDKQINIIKQETSWVIYLSIIMLLTLNVSHWTPGFRSTLGRCQNNIFSENRKYLKSVWIFEKWTPPARVLFHIQYLYLYNMVIKIPSRNPATPETQRELSTKIKVDKNIYTADCFVMWLYVR